MSIDLPQKAFACWRNSEPTKQAMIALQGMADVKVYQLSQKIPHHPPGKGDQKHLQLENLIETEQSPKKVQKKSSTTTNSENA